jgi:ABC-2 type transport system permease protein
VTSLATDATESIPVTAEEGLAARLKHVWRLVTVLTGMEIKLRYGDSALGYIWTIGKPMALFSILYMVFARMFGNSATPHFALYLIVGFMLWTFFSSGVGLTMTSIVANGTLIRKLPFPRIVIPLAASFTSFVTFGLSLFAVAVFVAVNGIMPRLNWLLLIPLIFELYLFVLGLGLILSVMYVRLRDVVQVWDLVVQVLFFASPIIYQLSQFPARVQQLMMLNPFTQVMQDARAIIDYPDHDVIVAPVGFTPLRVLPLVIVACTIGLGLLMFKHEEPWLPERV